MKKNFFLYSSLAVPLSFIGIPIYVYIANFYANLFSLSVSAIGISILLSRLVDVVQDPIIGFLSDKLTKKGISRKKIIIFNAPFLAASFYFLFNPIYFSDFLLYVWIAVSLIFVYTFFSFMVINYNAIAAEIAKSYDDRTRVNSIRESFGLIGIILASILPTLISLSLNRSMEDSLSLLALFMAPFLILTAIFFYYKVAVPEVKSENQLSLAIFGGIGCLFRDVFYKRLLLIFFINSIAVSVPAATFLFFVEDVLQAKEKAGIFLLLYFLSAAIMMPLWIFLARKFGKKRSWALSIFFSVVIFFWAFLLNDQNYWQFYYICFFSGLALGADLAIPPAILADIVNKNQSSKERISLYYAFWNMTSKLGLAIASSFSLIMLGLLDYREGVSVANDNSLLYLSLIYAILPCLIKLLVIFILFKSKIEEND